MYCHKCGTMNDEDSVFCVKCGTSINEQTKKDGKSSKKFDIPKFKNRNILKTTVILFTLLIMLSAVIIFIQYVNNKNENIDNIIQEDQGFVNMSISSVPSKANVYINNMFEGETPVTVALSEGEYKLKMNITGYKTVKTDINVTSDMYRRDIHVEFEPIDTVNNTNTSI